MRVVWSPLALDKLETTAKFIALDKPSAADKWINDIFDRTDLVSSQPELGREVPQHFNKKFLASYWDIRPFSIQKDSL
ncbi:type II toxin-antitoxin system RelE/ParE family toxin [Colwellia sp. E2M01]|uniref:type II toxin-antitoxin system RelE/ParE family toxin n=1 Tax=Colwellia sp. E2M01 TaxID=2841561 RepID=UPI001C08D33A|nr:type II toxin-antitoxin system RelE/ParE family toxin [Colwellia sp. E2M01]MBU2871246.1 type II toxin-antitoxin system RelE/ParE family toxin [Colwellia sp. E2M01]